MKSLADKYLPAKFMNELDRILNGHNSFRTTRSQGKASAKTRLERTSFYRLAFAQLFEMGYRLASPRNLGSRHIEALLQHWDQEGIAIITLHTRVSFLRTFCGWINKPGMVQDVHDYLPGKDVTRRTVAKRNRAWLPNGVEAAVVIARAREIDERLAVMLALEDAFGLRMKEAIEMHPAWCRAESGTALDIHEGTKGGRWRRIPIDTDYKREVFEWALRVAETGKTRRIRWPGRTWTQAKRRYYYLLAEKLGVNLNDLGVTSHGLRHEYAQEKYQDMAGLPSPIAGADPKQVDPVKHREAGIEVSRDLGHSRVQVMASYYGSHGHAMRKKD
ncbi:hypothetical protein ANAEL_00434 [Anaerolineales bacterium]|nr:hypothetical protein ANAEL_00434 [Anaerolineales bacterium]